MLVPPNLNKKEREAYDKIHVPKAKEFVNVGPKGGLRPLGGDAKPAATIQKTLKDKVKVKEKK